MSEFFQKLIARPIPSDAGDKVTRSSFISFPALIRHISPPMYKPKLINPVTIKTSLSVCKYIIPDAIDNPILVSFNVPERFM